MLIGINGGYFPAICRVCFCYKVNSNFELFVNFKFCAFAYYANLVIFCGFRFNEETLEYSMGQFLMKLLTTVRMILEILVNGVFSGVDSH